MNITILNVSIQTVPTAKGSYQVADVAYKNNTFQGKVEGKKVMSFGATKDAFGVLSTAQPGQTFEVNVVKNDKGYNDWVSMSPAGAAASSVPSVQGSGKPAGFAGAPAPARGNFETSEERAQRQVSIVRQSSLGHAVATLSVGAKNLKPEDVIKVAKQYEAFVHGRGETGFDDVPDFPAELAAPAIE